MIIDLHDILCQRTDQFLILRNCSLQPLVKEHTDLLWSKTCFIHIIYSKHPPGIVSYFLIPKFNICKNFFIPLKIMTNKSIIRKGILERIGQNWTNKKINTHFCLANNFAKVQSIVIRLARHLQTGLHITTKMPLCDLSKMDCNKENILKIVCLFWDIMYTKSFKPIDC